MRKIYFCFPYHGVGGVSLLFLRMAEELSSKGQAETWLVDYADGFMAKHRQKGLTHFLEYRDDGEVAIPPDAIAVLQSMTPWSIFPSLRFAPQTRILFWNCHPFNLVPTLPGLRRHMQHSVLLSRMILATLLRGYRNKMRRLVSLLLERRSLVFMDRPNVATTEDYLGIKIPEAVYLPIPASSANDTGSIRKREIRSEGLRFVWVGRVVDFKYYVLQRSLLELDRLQPQFGFPVKVTIVGSGEYAERLRNDSEKIKHVQLEFIDHLAPAELDAFLLTNTDILLAMGTSALEGAKLGIPTILLDVAYAPVPQSYRFQWLHERSGYTLGDLLGDEHIQPGNNSLAECIDMALHDYDQLSAHAKEYFMRNHELSIVATRFVAIVDAAACTYGALAEARVTGRGMLYGIFALIRKGMARS